MDENRDRNIALRRLEKEAETIENFGGLGGGMVSYKFMQTKS